MVKPVDPTQGAFDFGENPEKPQRGKVGPSEFDEELAKQREDRQEKARSRAAENEEFKDKRQPKSDLIRQAEIERMKEILNKPKVGSVRGGVGGGGSGGAELKSIMNPKSMKKGGKVKSASARADGCCIRGKTRA